MACQQCYILIDDLVKLLRAYETLLRHDPGPAYETHARMERLMARASQAIASAETHQHETTP